jgi:hypothetical protein
MYLAGAVLGLGFGLGVTPLPDSPRWLLLRSLRAPHRYPRTRAKAALTYFRPRFNSAEIDAELNSVIDTLTGHVRLLPPCLTDRHVSASSRACRLLI